MRASSETSDSWPTTPLSTGLTNTVAGFFWGTAALYMIGAGLFGYYAYQWFVWPGRGQGLGRQPLFIYIGDAKELAYAFRIVPWWAYLITGVLFIIWFYQAYKSAESRGATNRHWGAGWAIGSWFIPIGMFIIPKLVLNEIDRMSNHAAGRPPIKARWVRLPLHPASDYWYAAFILGFLIPPIALTLMELEIVELHESNFALLILIVATGYGVMAASGILGGMIVRDIGGNLQEDTIGTGSVSGTDENHNT